MPPKLPASKLTQRPGKGAEKHLGELELAIMRVAWNRASVTVRDVVTALNKKRPLAYTTVMTVMGRLADKGLLSAEKHGKTFHYRATHTRLEFEAHAAGQVVEALLNDFGGEVALQQFIEKLADAAPGQLARLEELARQAQEEHDER
jgi:predicted transcriptional regulator